MDARDPARSDSCRATAPRGVPGALERTGCRRRGPHAGRTTRWHGTKSGALASLHAFTLALLLDDHRLHRAQHAEELVLLGLADLELVERLHEVLDERVEVRRRNAHALVRGLHVLARVLAGAAGRFADLVDQVALELGQPSRIRRRSREEGVDPLV